MKLGPIAPVADELRRRMAEDQGRVTEPEADDPHTGDDELLDALTEARVALEEVEDEGESEAAIATALEALTTADTIRVAELKARASSAPPPVSPPMWSLMKDARRWHMAFNVATHSLTTNRSGACDGPDCVICSCVLSILTKNQSDPPAMPPSASGPSGERSET